MKKDITEEKLTSNLCFKVTPSDKEMYKQIAKLQGKSTGEWIRSNIEEHYKGHIKRKSDFIINPELKKAIKTYDTKPPLGLIFVIGIVMFLVLLILITGILL